MDLHGPQVRDLKFALREHRVLTEKLSQYIRGAAAKYLAAVDVVSRRSNQHEFGGLPSAGACKWLGSPPKGEIIRLPCRQVYLTDDTEDASIVDSTVSWYDARNEKRSPEYRLYYLDSPVTQLAKAGDFLLIAKLMDESLLMAIAPAGSTSEQQLRILFGLPKVDAAFTSANLEANQLLLPLQMMFDSLGIALEPKKTDDGVWLEKLIEKFGGLQFPSTAVFSSYARQTAEIDDPVKAPDTAILEWMGQEERLFRIYERHLVQDRLKEGFGSNGEEVDAFIGFSLSVQNRRKSRVGHAFESHLSYLFSLHCITYERGGGKNATENSAKPDFLFPSFAHYHDPKFPSAALTMLGAKTTCKDRWRQILSEADRIVQKHLATLEPAISQAQTNEMAAQKVTLVVPDAIKGTYNPKQQTGILSLLEFLEIVKRRQNR